MSLFYVSNRATRGIVDIPPSKSDSQRKILAAALANGESELSGFGQSDDEMAMIHIVQQFGAKVIDKTDRLLITGTDAFPEEATFFCGESGLSCRLITSIAAAHTGRFKISGTGSLNKRSMRFFEELFPAIGVRINCKEHVLPLRLEGPIKGGEFAADGSQGSQYISGLMMALPLAQQDSIVQIKGLVSRPYLHMTLSVLKLSGIQFEEINTDVFSISGKQHYQNFHSSIETDWSSASYWLLASALGLNVACRGLDLNSLQADRFILKAFEAAACFWHVENGLLWVDGSKRQAFNFDATHCPDLFPALAVFAALTPGTSQLKGVDRLINKESNRALALQAELGKLGVSIEIKNDFMYVYGQQSLRSAKVDSHGDHRIAMCLAIAALFTPNGLQIQDHQVVNKSYPLFWNVFQALQMNT